MKYLAAFVIGVGLMANGPAFAEGFVFKFSEGVPMEECVKSAKEDTELSRYQYEYEEMETVVDLKTYMRKTLSGWRVFRISTFQDKNTQQIKVYCDTWRKLE